MQERRREKEDSGRGRVVLLVVCFAVDILKRGIRLEGVAS